VKRRHPSESAQHPPASPAATPLPMPHERDESPEADLPSQEVVEQAHRDVENGLVDTDNYTRVAANASPATLRRGGVRRRGS